MTDQWGDRPIGNVGWECATELVFGRQGYLWNGRAKGNNIGDFQTFLVVLGWFWGGLSHAV